jgi:hypothetical protein
MFNTYEWWTKGLWLLTERIPTEILTIIHFPIELYNLFFGRESHKITYNFDYHREVAKDFWT